MTSKIAGDVLERVVACCTALNRSGVLRAEVSPRSTPALRLRDLSAAGLPCPLVLYWGVWRHAELNKDARRLLASLSMLGDIISSHLAIETRCHIVFTDTHARLNDVEDLLIKAALAELIEVAGGTALVSAMSALVPDAVPMPLATSAMLISGAERLHDQLELQARKLFGPGEARERAERYLCANLREAPHVFATWPTGIFVHLGPPELKVILPSMPLLYGYTGARGLTRKPWFD